jgi:hypothetical protein
MTYNEMTRLMGWATPNRNRWGTGGAVARGASECYHGPSKKTLAKRAAKRARKSRR